MEGTLCGYRDTGPGLPHQLTNSASATHTVSSVRKARLPRDHENPRGCCFSGFRRGGCPSHTNSLPGPPTVRSTGRTQQLSRFQVVVRSRSPTRVQVLSLFVAGIHPLSRWTCGLAFSQLLLFPHPHLKPRRIGQSSSVLRTRIETIHDQATWQRDLCLARSRLPV